MIAGGSAVAGSLRVSAGEEGNKAAVWQAPEGYDGCCRELTAGVFAARTGPDGHWTPAVLVNESPVTAGPADIVVMAGGGALVVWVWLDQPHEAANDVYVNLWSRIVDANGTWSSQQLVGNVSVHYVSFYYPRVFGPKIVAATDGGFGVFWGYNNGDPSPLEITRFDAAGGWTTTDALELPSIARETYPPVPFSASRVWNDGHGVFVTSAIDNVSQANDVLAIPYNDADGFGVAVRLDSIDPGDALSPTIAGNQAGEAFAVWRQYDGSGWGVYAARMNAQSVWANATLIAKARWGDLGAPNAVLDEAGRATVVWREMAGYAHYRAATVDPAAGAAPAVELLNTSCGLTCAATGLTAMAVDGSGTVTAAWVEHNALLIARHEQEGGWTAVVTPENMSATVEDVRIVAGTPGDAVVVWAGATTFQMDPWVRPGDGYSQGPDGLRALSLRSPFGPLHLEITTPEEGLQTAAATVWVSGSATPGATLVVAGAVTEIAQDGSFGLWVPLALGENKIAAKATRTGWSPASDAVTITRVEAPPPDSNPPGAGGAALAFAPPDFFLPILLLLALLVALLFLRQRSGRRGDG